MIVTFEGGDQAGKKTQSALLAKRLKSLKIKTKLFSFPDYSTPIGKEIDKYLHGKRKFPPQTIHTLLAANRWEKVDEIKKAQEKNSVVIMNRYAESNLVYGLANRFGLTSTGTTSFMISGDIPHGDDFLLNGETLRADLYFYLDRCYFYF